MLTPSCSLPFLSDECLSQPSQLSPAATPCWNRPDAPRKSWSSLVLLKCLLTCPSPPTAPWGCGSFCLIFVTIPNTVPTTQKPLSKCLKVETCRFHVATQKAVICLGHPEVPSAGLSIVFSNSHISTICTCFPLRERTVSFTEFRSSVLPPLPVSFHPNLSVSRVCYQGFPDSPLPFQLGFLFTCWDEPLTTQPAFLISVCTHGIRKISCLMRPAPCF